MTLARALLATGIDFDVHAAGDGFRVCWDTDPELPVIGGARRRLTADNRDLMVQWCGGRYPDDLRQPADPLISAPQGYHVLVPTVGGVEYRIAALGDIVERTGPGSFRVVRAGDGA